MLQEVSDADDLRECARRLAQLVIDTAELPTELIAKIQSLYHELEMFACELDDR